MFHYLHHRYFECNYAGSDAAFMDIFFGTFKASFSEHPVDKDGPKAREDAKSSLRLVPTREFVTYLSLSALCVALWEYAAINRIPLSPLKAWGLASVVGFGPVLLATLVSYAFGAGRGVKPVHMNVAANLMHLTVGSVFCSVPITYACRLALQ
jgi:hypothetical protein